MDLMESYLGEEIRRPSEAELNGTFLQTGINHALQLLFKGLYIINYVHFIVQCLNYT